MSNVKQQYDVVIIGAGHCGLCLSYLLSKSHIEHIVLEKNEIGSTWINQRWDNFKFVTPNKFNVLFPEDNPFFNDNEFCTAKEFSKYLKIFALENKLPVFENHTVNSVTLTDEEFKFSLAISSNVDTINLTTRNVAVCSGYQNAKYIPPFANNISESISQLHSSEYKNSKLLRDGNVLVVGSGQSGAQIAEELVLDGRKVFLSTSKVGRLPRNYRGKDIVELLKSIGFYDVKKDDVKDSQVFSWPQPLLSGNSKSEELSLSYLEKIGVTLFGSIKSINDNTVQLNDDVRRNIIYAEEFAYKIKELIENHFSPQHESPKRDDLFGNLKAFDNLGEVNLGVENITTVIWATGFRPDFTFLHLNYKNHEGSIEQRNGSSPISGLYFLGIPWQRKRKSGIIMGALEDSKEVCKAIECNILP